MPAGEYQQSHSDVNAASYPSKGDTSIVMEFGHSVAKCFNIFKESQKVRLHVKVINVRMLATNLTKFNHLDQTNISKPPFLISELCYSFIH